MLAHILNEPPMTSILYDQYDILIRVNTPIMTIFSVVLAYHAPYIDLIIIPISLFQLASIFFNLCHQTAENLLENKIIVIFHT